MYWRRVGVVPIYRACKILSCGVLGLEVSVSAILCHGSL